MNVVDAGQALRCSGDEELHTGEGEENAEGAADESEDEGVRECGADAGGDHAAGQPMTQGRPASGQRRANRPRRRDRPDREVTR